MKKLKILATLLLISNFSFGQILKIQSGISISNIDFNLGSNGWKYENKELIGYTFSVGADYLNEKYYNLSSNLLLLKKGGKVSAKRENELDIDRNLDLNLDYLSLNTTFELKYPLKNKITPFLSYGPRIDMLLNKNYLINYNKYNYGLLIGGGLKYDMEKIQIGLRTDYYINLKVINKENTHSFGIINDRTFTCNFTVGYKLK